jgi:hypothetical protein
VCTVLRANLPLVCKTNLLIPLYCLLFLLPTVALPQQNNTLFFMHSIPQSNFLNPAVQQDCRLFIGLPVISSMHVNGANSGFTMNQLLEKQPDSSYRIDAYFVTDKLAPRNFLTTEVHTTLLALGLRSNAYYFTFSINEKDNSFVFYQRDIVSLALNGNTQFEGESVSMQSTGIFFNHYREYALGVSKQVDDAKTFGVKAKLLFGKLNAETRKMDVGLFTEDSTFNLSFDSDARVNASLPYSLETDNNGEYQITDKYYAPLSEYILNRSNPGFALDFGFIYRYSDALVFSGSLLDLGFIRYASHLTNYRLTGNYMYDGPLGDSVITDDYMNSLFNSLSASMDNQISADPYYSFLTPRVLLGASLEMSRKININALWYNRFHQMKYQTGFMLSALARPLKYLETSMSWSYMNRSALNLGFGIAYGRSPLQIYIVSDNILAPLFPMDTKNVNLRFGLNIHLGCSVRNENLTGKESVRKEKIKGCGCFWLQQDEESKARKERLSHGKLK